MVDYIGNMLDDITEDMKMESATPTTHHRFEIAEYTTKLFQTDTYLFHHFVAQLLYLLKRAHTYIQLAVYFLCTREREPETYVYKNLVMVMKYIQVNIGLSLILSINKSENIK